jgi:hypothetical protein
MPIIKPAVASGSGGSSLTSDQISLLTTLTGISNLNTLLSLLGNLNNIPNLTDLLTSLGAVGGTIRVPVVISEQTLNAQSSVTIDGLNGNEDGDYLIEFDGSLSTYGVISALPNDVSNGFEGIGYISTNGGGTASVPANSGFVLHNPNWNIPGDSISLKATLNAVTGKARIMKSFVGADGMSIGWNVDGSLTSIWNDTTTNIRSFVLNVSPGTLTGTLRLCKVLEVNLAGSS